MKILGAITWCQTHGQPKDACRIGPKLGCIYVDAVVFEERPADSEPVSVSVRVDDLSIAVEWIDLAELSWVFMDEEKFAPIREAIGRLESALPDGWDDD